MKSISYIKTFRFLFPLVILQFFCQSVGGDGKSYFDFGSSRIDQEIARYRFQTVGDWMLHQSQLNLGYRFKTKTYDFDSSLDWIRPYFEGSDFVFGNLETTIPSSPENYSGYPRFGSPPEFVESISKLNFHVLSTANNHSADKGTDGVLNTIQTVKKNKIVPIGTYSKESYPWEKYYIHKLGKLKMGLLNYTYSTNGIPNPPNTVIRMIKKEDIQNDIFNIKQLGADLVFVSYHFGLEYQTSPSPSQIDAINWAKEAGASIIMGGHPHVLQRVEWNSKSIVAYSLGNFWSAQRNRHTDGGIILEWDLVQFASGKSEIQNVEYVPIWVYPNFGKPGKTYLILPVEEFLENNHPILKLDPKSWKDMMLFYRDTLELLKPLKTRKRRSG